MSAQKVTCAMNENNTGGSKTEPHDGDKDPPSSVGDKTNQVVSTRPVNMQNKRRSANYGDNGTKSEVERKCPKVNCPENIVSIRTLSD